MTKLSVNINKIALIRNARGSNYPDLLQVAADCEEFGAQGITVHPRPDQRHVRFDDIPSLKQVVTTELNIEGYPSREFLQLVLKNRPHQCTLVPDAPEAITSDHGWDTVKHQQFLQQTVKELQDQGIRVSLFIDPIPERLEAAKETGPYAHLMQQTNSLSSTVEKEAARSEAVIPFSEAAAFCRHLGLGINAGHDLNLDNLRYFKQHVPGLLEVSIGHALVCDAIYYGLKNAIQLYLRELE